MNETWFNTLIKDFFKIVLIHNYFMISHVFYFISLKQAALKKPYSTRLIFDGKNISVIKKIRPILYSFKNQSWIRFLHKALSTSHNDKVYNAKRQFFKQKHTLLLQLFPCQIVAGAGFPCGNNHNSNQAIFLMVENRIVFW